MMKLVIVRHAKAEDREIFAAMGRDDRERPLTDGGRKQARRTARAIKTLIPNLDVLATSPLVRARDTAERLARPYKKLRVQELTALVPGTPAKTVGAWLAQQPADATVAIVGHEPELSVLASWFLAGRNEPMLTLKKSGACLLEFDAAPAAGAAHLAWLLTPRQMRAIAED